MTEGMSEGVNNEPKSEPILVCMADVPLPTKKERASHESGYRRGYHQGFFACLTLVEAGVKHSRISELHDLIHAWRMKGLEGKTWELPPTL